MKAYSLLISTFLSLVTIHAQDRQEKELKKELDNLVSQRLETVAPGCAVLVARKGTVIYEKAFGKANLELNMAMQPGMVFRIGSVTKQYTAIAILQLVEQGKISLQDSIQKFVKEFPSKGHTITIENLLTHTSGVIDYEALDFHIPNAIRIDFPAKEIIDSVGQLPLDSVPGTRFHYSNSNYFLLAYIIEQVSGKSYKDYLAENIFKPAGLTNTYYDSPTEIIPGRVSGYARYNSKYFNAGCIIMSQVFGAGALVSNVEDLFKWHQSLYTDKLVKKETLERAFTPYKLSDGSSSGYGYGWFIKDRGGDQSIEHAGGIDGFQSDEIYFPQQDVFVATLYNSLNEGGDDPSFMALDNEIATLAIGRKLTQEVKVDTTVLRQYNGVYEVDTAHPAIVSLENNQLYLEAPAGGLPKSPLFAKSQSVFFLKIIPAEIEFTRDSTNKVIQLITRYRGKTEVCKKIK